MKRPLAQVTDSRGELCAGDVLLGEPVESDDPHDHCGPLLLLEVDGRATKRVSAALETGVSLGNHH